MRLLNFYTADDETHLGLVQGDQVLDLTASAGGRREFSSVMTWLRVGKADPQEEEKLRDEWPSSAEHRSPLRTLRHAPLVDRDTRIFCVGLNYVDHAAENNLPPPPAPIFFSKLSSVVIPHGGKIPLPTESSEVDYEAEMAVVLGKRADCADEVEASRCVAGYTILNDVTARDLQRKDQQWFRSKNCNGFGPLGPWLVTADEVPDPDNLEISLMVNGQIRQHSNTSRLVFPPAALISRLSQTLVLEPGDIISTGTPAGIGAKRVPPLFLKEGDEIQIEVTCLGTLQNRVGGK